MMKKKRLFWIPIVVVVVAAGVGGYFYFKNKAATTAAAASSSSPLQTATVKKGNLIISASVVGTIIANQDVKDPKGLVTSLLSARLNVLQAQQTYDSLVNALPTDLATAQYNLLTAEATLKTDQATRAVYTEAKCDDTTTQSDLVAYNNAKDAYNTDPTTRNYNTYISTRDAWYYCISPWPQASIDLADATVKVDEQTISDLKTKIAALSSGTTSTDVEVAGDKLVISKAQLQALLPVALLKPTDPIVVSSLQSINTMLNSDKAVTLLDDLSTPLLDVYIDEADLSSAVVGNKVNISFDSLPDTTFTGKLVYVYPSLTSTSGTNVVEALAQIDTASYKVNQELPVSMSATVEIITAQANNALLVPIQALRDLGNGKYSVFVVENGNLTLTPVEVGIKDDTYAVITSGLTEGQVVSTGIVETTK